MEASEHQCLQETEFVFPEIGVVFEDRSQFFYGNRSLFLKIRVCF